jgi:hypothetical protein
MRGALDVFSLEATEQVKMFSDAAYSPAAVAMNPALPLDTTAFAGGARHILLERRRRGGASPDDGVQSAVATAAVAARIDDAVRAAVRDALAEVALFARMDPFARSHHSDSISAASPPGATRSPERDARYAFKQRVAAHYGLDAGEQGRMVDMFGVTRPTADVTLAHVWPSSYTNWQDPCDELALPVGFHEDPRNFLLLPADVHAAFDAGDVVFVPAAASVSCHVLPGARVADGVQRLHGELLHLPRGQAPFKRLLAYFALRAVDRRAHVDAGLQATLDEALSASADEAGSEAVQAVALRMRRVGIISARVAVQQQREPPPGDAAQG